MADLFQKCFEFKQKTRIIADEFKSVAEKILFDLSPVENFGPEMVKDGKHYLQFSTNDYLGLTAHPEVRRAALEAAQKWGISAPMGARPLTGTTPLHMELGREVADFKRTEDALTFSTGANAMMGTIACLFGPDDLIVMDQYAHASLVCGARIARSTVKFFKHNDPESLDALLARSDPKKATGVVIDGVYSMRGNIAPIPELVEVKNKYGARLLIDDAHGTGVNGENGRGTAERLGCEDGVDLHMGTFSKAFVTSGGFIAGPKEVVEFIRYMAPTMLFTKSTSAIVVCATLASLRAARAEPERRVKLWENTRFLHDGLREIGIYFGDTQTPITPIQMNGTGAVIMASELREKYSIWAAFVTYPAIRFGTSILRVIPTANHTREHLEAFLNALGELKKEHPDFVVTESAPAS
ncbi:MAG: aminotransferase class I/II-fold pyridoxal phosphate-dependent enzyme [Planctomycetota bacterium]